MVRTISICLVSIISTAGCAAGSGAYTRLQSDYRSSVAEPAPPAGPDTTRSPSVLTDGAVPGRTLDRAAFVRAVLRANPGIDAARQAVRAAMSRVRRAGAFEDPMVEVGLAPLSIFSSRVPFGYQLGVSQKLPWFGKRGFEAEAAVADAEAAKDDFEAVRRDLALSAVDLYDRYFVAMRALEINAQHVALLKALRGAAAAQFESGRGAAQDPLQAETELSQLDRDTVMLTSERDVVVAEMNALLHRDPGAPLPAPPAELSRPPVPDTTDPKQLEAEALANRPDIASLHARARAESAREARASRDYFPDFTVSTSYSSMWSMPEHRWMVGLAFNLPVQRGVRAGAVDEALARRAELESAASRLEDTAREQAYASLTRLRESNLEIDIFEKRLIPSARDQIDAARAGFTASRNSFVAVIEAERNLRNIELQYAMTRAECDRRHAELERALGLVPGLGGKDGIHGP